MDGKRVGFIWMRKKGGSVDGNRGVQWMRK
jgi:hypothetical protein